MSYGKHIFPNLYSDCFCGSKSQSTIQSSWEVELYKYITGIIKNKEQLLLAINGMPDHIHILIAMGPTCCLSDLVREIKKSSNTFIKEQNFSKTSFNWQAGFGAFSYNQRQLDMIVNYINNQKLHHEKISFQMEYLKLLEDFKITYDNKYLFDF